MSSHGHVCAQELTHPILVPSGWCEPCGFKSEDIWFIRHSPFPPCPCLGGAVSRALDLRPSHLAAVTCAAPSLLEQAAPHSNPSELPPPAPSKASGGKPSQHLLLGCGADLCVCLEPALLALPPQPHDHGILGVQEAWSPWFQLHPTTPQLRTLRPACSLVQTALRAGGSFWSFPKGTLNESVRQKLNVAHS